MTSFSKDPRQAAEEEVRFPGGRAMANKFYPCHRAISPVRLAPRDKSRSIATTLGRRSTVLRAATIFVAVGMLACGPKSRAKATNTDAAGSVVFSSNGGGEGPNSVDEMPQCCVVYGFLTVVHGNSQDNTLAWTSILSPNEVSTPVGSFSAEIQ
jgi:hypothetical protein